jgi:hypothetical protein
MQGWIKLHRSISDNDLWLSEPFSYGQAWVDLLINASHKESLFFIRGIEIRLNRGDLGWSEVTLSKRWKWSRGKVRRYLGMLKNRGMIVQQTNQATSVISICNYCTYQSENVIAEQQTVQQTEHQTVQQTDSRRYTYKNVKNEKNEKNIKTQSRAAALDYSAWPSLASEQVLKDWLDMRKRLKANVSQTVINSFCTELNKAAAAGYSVDQCLSECVTRNWRGFKVDWLLNSEAQNGNRKINNYQTRPTREQRMEQALNEVFGTDSGALEGDFEKIVSNGLD